MKPFNLIEEAWIPVRLTDGRSKFIAPAEICLPEVAYLDLPRVDFQGAMHEFLIGLLQTAMPPASVAEKLDLLQHPPSREQLAERFNTIKRAFNLNGEGPLFMQERFAGPPPQEAPGTDKDARDETKVFPIALLLLDSGGDKGIEEHADFFAKASEIPALSPAATAAALYALQVFSGGGGRGQRQSARGGGPVTTLVDLGATARGRLPHNLWTLLWGNVVPGAVELNDAVFSIVFPWFRADLGPQPKDSLVTTSDHPGLHRASMYWPMPRRVRIHWEEGEGRACGVFGYVDAACLAASFERRPLGLVYKPELWRHPLTPYATKSADDPKGVGPRKMLSGGVAYKDWPAFWTSRSTDDGQPAEVVSSFQRQRNDLEDRIGTLDRIGIAAFGYELDQAKAVAWHEARIPVELIAESLEGDFQDAAQSAIDQAYRALKDLKSQSAQAGPDKAAKGPRNQRMTRAFWAKTEGAYRVFLQNCRMCLEIENNASEPNAAKDTADRALATQAWLEHLREAALEIFDEAFPSPLISIHTRAIIRARHRLDSKLSAHRTSPKVNRGANHDK